MELNMADPEFLLVAMRCHLEFKSGRLYRVGELKLDLVVPALTIWDSDSFNHFQIHVAVMIGHLDAFDLDRLHLPSFEIERLDIDDLWVIFMFSVGAHHNFDA